MADEPDTRTPEEIKEAARVYEAYKARMEAVKKAIEAEKAEGVKTAEAVQKFVEGGKITEVTGPRKLIYGVGGNREGHKGATDPVDPQTYEARFSTHQYSIENNTGTIGKITLKREDGKTMEVPLTKNNLGDVVPVLQKAHKDFQHDPKKLERSRFEKANPIPIFAENNTEVEVPSTMNLKGGPRGLV